MDSDEILDANFQEAEGQVEFQSVTPGKFALLFILSLSLYGVWWMYKVWAFYKEKENLDILPVARAIFSIFFAYGLFEKILNQAKEQGYDKNYSPEGLFALFVISNLCTRLPDPGWLLSYFGVFVFLSPLAAFNWTLDQSDFYRLHLPNGFNGRQIAILIIGGLVWLLIIASFLIPEENF